MLRILTKSNFLLFGTEKLNIRITDRDPLNQNKLDSHLDRYGHIIRAFVVKRRLLRSQIWPKIHIIDDVPQEQLHHLKTQSLFNMKKSMKDDVMKAIAQNDPQKINSAFIISNFSEDHFKQMLDQYLGKVLVCGKAPTDPEAAQKVQTKAKQLYHYFYFGQPRSPLERQLEQLYLSAKQQKFMRSQRQKMMNKHLVEQVVWTQRDQRLLQEKKNWMSADMNLTDLNYRTYFEPLQYPQRKESYLTCEKLQKDWTWADNLRWKYFTSKYYTAQSSRYFSVVQQHLFIRILNHLKSTQFTSLLNIPHDYMIQAQMSQIHFWLLMNRLRQIGTLKSKTLAKRIQFMLNQEIIRSAQSVNLKKSNVLTTTLQRMLEMNNTILEMHFNQSDITKNNPYIGIDAMVWSIAFAEKVHRYADQVYLFADYLIQNVKHLEHHTQQDIFNGIIEFDPYLVSHNYRKKIEKINPPLSAAEFQKQFNSNSPNKDYYYSKFQTEIDEAMRPEQRITKSKIDTSFSFSQFMQPFRNIRIKYLTLKTYDHFSRMQEQKRKIEEQEKKGVWKSKKDEVKGVKHEFQQIHNIKNRRKRQQQNEEKQQGMK